MPSASVASYRGSSEEATGVAIDVGALGSPLVDFGSGLFPHPDNVTNVMRRSVATDNSIDLIFVGIPIFVHKQYHAFCINSANGFGNLPKGLAAAEPRFFKGWDVRVSVCIDGIGPRNSLRGNAISSIRF
jgi:hypothetical protein